MKNKLQPLPITFRHPEQPDGMTDQEQAQFILETALRADEEAKRAGKTIPGFGITYSANAQQTRDCMTAYAASSDTKPLQPTISGANQAQVVGLIIAFLRQAAEAVRQGRTHRYQSLINRFRIIPITTMDADGPENFAKSKEVLRSIIYLFNYLGAGWQIYAWQNQLSHTNRFAVGGGMAKDIPGAADQNKKIIQPALRFAADIPEPSADTRLEKELEDLYIKAQEEGEKDHEFYKKYKDDSQLYKQSVAPSSPSSGFLGWLFGETKSSPAQPVKTQPQKKEAEPATATKEVTATSPQTAAVSHHALEGTLTTASHAGDPLISTFPRTSTQEQNEAFPKWLMPRNKIIPTSMDKGVHVRTEDNPSSRAHDPRLLMKGSQPKSGLDPQGTKADVLKL